MKDKLAQLSKEEKRELLRQALRKKEEKLSSSSSYPLSNVQNGLLFISKLNPEFTEYNMPYAFRLKGHLDRDALEKSINEIIRRHVTLRTVFVKNAEGKEVQLVQDFSYRALPFTDISALEDNACKQQINTIIQSEASHIFDLSQGPLTRFRLVQTGSDEYVFLYVVHHIVFDGISMSRFIEELRHCYEAFANSSAPSLPELSYTYTTFSQENHSLLGLQEEATQLKFWKKQLAGAPPVLELSTDNKRPLNSTGRGSIVEFPIPDDVMNEIRSLSQREGATVFMTLLSAFYILLHRYTEQEDILIGTPVSLRGRSEMMPLIGLLINTIVLRADLSGEPDFLEFLRRVKNVALDAFSNQNASLSKVVEAVKPDRRHGRMPLFQVMFTLEYGSDKEWEMAGVSVSQIPNHCSASKYDLTFVISDNPAGSSGAFEYNTDLFKEETIKRMAGHYLKLLSEVLKHQMVPIWQLNLLSEAEFQRVQQWNSTSFSYPEERTICQVFEEKSKEIPQQAAVFDQHTSITYEKLNEEAEKLKKRLLKFQLTDNSVVAICMNRSIEMIVAMLAVWKAGAAYLPLDTAHPVERLAYMTEDAKVPVVITKRKLMGKLPGHLNILCTDEEGDASESGPDAHIAEATADKLAYVIYTSGSTGNPKGVGVRHANLTNLVYWHNNTFNIKEKVRTSQLAGISFDAAVWEIWPTLAAGGTLYITDEETRISPERLQQWLISNEIDVSFIPTPLAEVLMTLPWPESVPLRVMLTGGDKLHRFPSASLPFELINNYGPTETTVVATSCAVPKGDYEGAPLIGRPIANTRVYILDKHQKPVPVGVPGELYIGGSGVSKGYIFRPDFSESAFAEVAIRPELTEYLYRTGDIVRYLPDGNIEYLCRRDFQVKIRGLRIELGEIETLLASHSCVKEAVVITKETASKDTVIVAYVTTYQERQIGEAELKAALKLKLPDYMIPARIIFMDDFLLNSSGKIDRKALPEVQDEEAAVTILEPQSKLESDIAAIWAEVLGKARVGRTDNFFDIGGHSLLLTRVHEKLCNDLKADIQLMELFQYTTVQQIACRIAGTQATEPAGTSALEESLHKGQEERIIEEDIAIIGLACRVPGANCADKFWENLRDGVDSIRWFTRDELLESGANMESIDLKNYVPARGFLHGADQFDAEFFHVPPREAEIMDPQHRLLLENTWEALEHAGYDPSRYKGHIGVYAGCAFNTYLINNLLPNRQYIDMVGIYPIFMNNDKDSLATRIAYKLGLTGPAVTVQTACSTSLVAVHMACQALYMNDCDIALAGGVTVRSPLKEGYLYHEGEISSPIGQCRAFDNEAQGTIGGMGTGTVVLKRLSKAKKDGDTIYAVIKGSAINNDGSSKIGFTAPSVEGQEEVISKALRRANVSPDEISYVEAHGTGTPLGDPVEANALIKAFRKLGAKKYGYCGIGSVKTNIGHLDAAAGVVGLIKTVLSLRHRKLPPSLNFETPNRKICFDDSPFYVNQKLQNWEGCSPRRAGVSALGVGGTNAHVILEEALQSAVPKSARKQNLIVLSARTSSALEKMTDQISSYIADKTNDELADAAYTLQVGRKEFPFRRILVADDIIKASEDLKNRTAGRVQTKEVVKASPSVVFMFSAKGVTGRSSIAMLYQTEAVFRQEVDGCLKLSEAWTRQDIKNQLFINPDTEKDNTVKLNETEQDIVLFITSYALAKLWMSWGIYPKALTGNGIGKYVAACLSGVFSLQDLLGIIGERSKWINNGDISLLHEALQKAICKDIEIRLICGKTCAFIDSKEATDPAYWENEMIKPKDMVQNEYNMEKLVNAYDCIFLKIGSGEPKDRAQNVVDSINNDEPAGSLLMDALGKLWLAGVNVDWNQLYPNENRRRIALPSYPFERKRFWVDILRKDEAGQLTCNEAAASNDAALEPEEEIDLQKEIQNIVIKICQEILGEETIQIDDDFYDAGGDSLMVSRIVNRIREIFPIELPLSTLYKYPVLRDFAQQIEQRVMEKMGEMSV